METPSVPTVPTVSTTVPNVPTLNEVDFIPVIQKLIAEGDLDTLTLKDILRELAICFHCDMKPHRKFIKKKVSQILQEKEDMKDTTAVEIVHKRVENGEEEDVDIIGDDKKEEEGEDEVVDIENVEPEQQPPMNVPDKSSKAMQELLYDSIRFGSSSGTRSGGKRNRGPGSESAALPKKKKKVAADKSKLDAGVVKKKRVGAGFTKETILSASLAGFLGVERLPRTEVVKRLHEYIREHGLQNPKDKRKIMFDAKLQDIFKRKSSDFFNINRLISKHVKPVDEVV